MKRKQNKSKARHFNSNRNGLLISVFIVWVFLVAGYLPAWGASGTITVSSPALPPNGEIIEVDSDFTFSGSFALTSDDSPTGETFNTTYCPPGTYYNFSGKAWVSPYMDSYYGVLWASAYTQVDGVSQPGDYIGNNVWNITGGPPTPVGSVSFSKTISIANLDVNTVHKATFKFVDRIGVICEGRTYNGNQTVNAVGDTIAEKTVSFKVIKPKDCKLDNQPFESTVSITSGNLSHSQELFSTKGNGMPTSISLYYNSLEAHVANLGPGWNHSYDIELATMLSGSVVLREADGTRHIYKQAGATYTSQSGDSSSLVKNADGSYSVNFLGGLIYNFTSIGKISSINDRFGNMLTFIYDNGNLSTVSDSSGRTTQFSYDTNNLLSTIVDPAGNPPYRFDYTAGYLTSVTNPAVVNASGNPQTSQWIYTYNSKGLLESKTDPNNNMTSYTYDANNRVLQATDPTLNTRTVNYAPLLDVTNRTTITGSKTATFVEKDQGVWTNVYDGALGLLTNKTDPNGKTTSYYYNTDRTVRAKTEPFDNNVRVNTFYTYDSHGNVLTQTNPVNIATYSPAIDPQTVDIASLATTNPPIKTAISNTYAFNVFGVTGNDQLTSTTDNRGSVPTTTTYQYTVENGFQVTRVTDADNHVSTTRNYANGNILDVSDANQQITTYSYYPDTPENRSAGIVGLLESVTGPDSVITLYSVYDKTGNPTEIKTIGTDNKEIRTVQTFDALGRLRTVTRYAQGLPDNVTTYAYDKNGNRSYQKDPEGMETTFLYDYHGKVLKVTDAQQHDTQYSYSVSSSNGTSCSSCSGGGGDKLTSVTDAKQQSTSYQYDVLGRLILETDPLGKKIKYAYYDHGKVKEKIDATTMPEKVLITYYYDSLRQLVKKHDADNTEETYSYDPKGRLETATNANISYSYTYYANGWPKSVTDSNGRTIRYDQYDGIGQKKLVTYFPGTTDQRQITYVYDPANLNRIKTITSAAGTFTYGYDSFERRNSLSYPNNISASYLYDDLNRLTKLTYNQASTPFLDYGYVFDKAGNRIEKTGTSSEKYRYDDVYRLKQASTTTDEQKFVYDAVGNRLAGPGPKDTGYQYDAGNRMLIGKLFGYAYDNYGNQTARIIPNAPDKQWILTWDYENRLTKMELSKGSSERQTVTFKYDPLGRRIEKRVVTTINGAAKTTNYTYVHDGDNIALEIMADATVGATKTFYTNGTGTDEHLALERNGNFYFYHADGLGSVTAITDQSKKIVQSYTYDSFGMVKPSTDFKNSYTYTGREWDRESGLYFYRARYYDPMEGRFISKDPIGFKGGDMVLYGYVQNNPINATDPMGLMSCNGTWRQHGYNRNYNIACTCYWICVPCDGAMIWGGNNATLPTTHGTMTNSRGGAGTRSGDDCLCNKPGPDKDCCKK
jgi:RHS repeat-associated protein